MIAWFLSFLKGPLGGVVMGGVAAAALIGCVVLGIRGSFAEARAERLQTEIDAPETGWRAKLADCQAGKTALAQAIDKQNAEVLNIAKESTARLQSAAKAVGVAKVLTERAIDKAGTILARQSGSDTCQSANDILLSGVADE